MKRRPPRWPFLFVIAIVFGLGIYAALAVTVHDDPVIAVRYCIEDAPPGVTLSQARSAFDSDIMPAWEAVPGPDQGNVLNLSRITDCDDEHDITIVTANLADGVFATTSPTQIKFNTDFMWSTAANPSDDDISFQGIAMHEVGHTLNYGHSGNFWWNVEGNQGGSFDPTMDAVVGSKSTEDWATLEKDDEARVPWSEGDGVGDWWSYSPGFEDGWGWWITSGSVSLSSTTYSGSKSALLGNSGDVVKQRIIYDPIKAGCGSCPVVYPGMDLTPTPRLWTAYRDNGNQAGGIELRSKRRNYHYNTSVNSKTFISRTPFTSPETHKTCNTSNQN